MNRAMLEKLQKHLRSFKRDYWDRELQPGETLTLRQEMGVSAGLVLSVCTVLGLFLPPMAPALALLGALTAPCMLAIRMNEIRKEVNKTSTAEIELCGNTRGIVTISGPGHAVNVVANTQAMLYRQTRPPRLHLRTPDYNVIPAKILAGLAPYFNDCAEAAAQLEARVDGKLVDSFALGHYCVGEANDPAKYWYEEVKPLLSAQGAMNKRVADRHAAGNAAASQVENGLSRKVSVRPIRLKAKP